MKYIKTYENINKSKFYWLVKTDTPFFEIALYMKFNLPYDTILNWLRVRNGGSFGPEIYMMPYDKSFGNDIISWTNNGIEGKKWLDQNNYIYQGILKYTKEELKQIDAVIASKKYNL